MNDTSLLMWHTAADFRIAAIASAPGGTSAVPASNAHVLCKHRRSLPHGNMGVDLERRAVNAHQTRVPQVTAVEFTLVSLRSRIYHGGGLGGAFLFAARHAARRQQL